MNRSSTRGMGVRRALLGVSALLVFSLGTAWSRESQQKDAGEVTLRRISPGEVMDILNRFPGMVPGSYDSRRNDTGLMAKLFPLSEVTAEPLENTFSSVRFYKGLLGITPPYPYLMAVGEDRRYGMPGNFNQLLLDNGLKVTDRTILSLAEGLAMLTIASQPIWDLAHEAAGNIDSLPPVTVLDARRIDEINSATPFKAKLKMQIGEQVEEWSFSGENNELFVTARKKLDE